MKLYKSKHLHYVNDKGVDTVLSAGALSIKNGDDIVIMASTSNTNPFISGLIFSGPINNITDDKGVPYKSYEDLLGKIGGAI